MWRGPHEYVKEVQSLALTLYPSSTNWKGVGCKQEIAGFEDLKALCPSLTVSINNRQVYEMTFMPEN